MKQESVRKIGFVSALSICFTSIVGIGIFLKNSSVGTNVEGNGWSWLATWLISGIIAILLAFHFGKISSIKSKNNTTGLNAWIEEISDSKNQWFKKIVQTNYGLFYNPLLSLCLSFFCSEFFILFIQSINPNVQIDVWVYVLISLCLMVFFILNNYFSIKFSSYISITTSILKLVPLLMVILIGLIFANVHNYDSSGTTSNGFDESIKFDKAIQGIMLSIPSVLFAFDSFIGVGSWSTHVKGGEKTISKVIVSAMILVTIVYCLICLSSIFHFNKEGTTILNVLIDSLPSNAKKGITIFISLFIFISAFGTSNSVCGATLNEFKNMISLKKIIFAKSLTTKFGEKKATLIYCSIVLLIWSLIMFVPSMILNSDSLIDGFSNVVVVFIFLIYAYTIVLFWKNIYLKDDSFRNGSNKKIYSTSVWLTFALLIVVVFLNLFYVFLNGIQDWNKLSSWGLYLAGNGLNNLSVLIFHICFSFIFFTFPFLNDWILNKK